MYAIFVEGALAPTNVNVRKVSLEMIANSLNALAYYQTRPMFVRDAESVLGQISADAPILRTGEESYAKYTNASLFYQMKVWSALHMEVVPMLTNASAPLDIFHLIAAFILALELEQMNHLHALQKAHALI